MTEEDLENLTNNFVDYSHKKGLTNLSTLL